MSLIPRWLVIHALLLGCALAGEAPGVGGLDIRHQAGDDPRWAEPAWDDRAWQSGNIVPTRSGIHWLRYHVNLPPSGLTAAVTAELMPGCADPIEGPGSAINCVYLAAPFAYELYWDGRLIGRSGVVGADREAEVVGPLDNLITIPENSRQPGEHVIALRMSSYRYNFAADQVQVGIALGDYAAFLRREMRRPIFPIAGMGATLLVALISGVLFWFVDRRRPLLLCSVLSFALALFYLLIAWRWLHNDPHIWFRPRLVAITGLMTVIATVFPWLLIEQFSAPRRTWWLALLLPLLGAAWFSSEIYETKTLWLCRAMLTVSLGIAGWAVWRGRPGARFILVGVLVGLLTIRTARREFLDPWLFVTFDVLVLFVFTALGAQLRTSRQRAREATLSAVRLEIELLKKNIQPHFLLNTLATIMEVIEQDPRVAVTLIEALAGEFRILAGVSDKKLVPIGQELELCRAHLRIMALRKGAACVLEATGINDQSLVPPALFHTLVENGLTHLRPIDGKQRFELREERHSGVTRYTFTAYGEALATPRTSPEGTGLRYVKARLEESFSGAWTLEGGPVAGGWRTVIEIRDRPAAATQPVFAVKGLPA